MRGTNSTRRPRTSAPNATPPKLHTIREVAQMSGRNYATVRIDIKAGILPAIQHREGGKHYIKDEDARRYAYGSS